MALVCVCVCVCVAIPGMVAEGSVEGFVCVCDDEERRVEPGIVGGGWRYPDQSQQSAPSQPRPAGAEVPTRKPRRKVCDSTKRKPKTRIMYSMKR